jgi:fused signal recognition particle receptor
MVFNWFRRQFSDRSQDDEVEEEKTDGVQPETELSEPEKTEEASEQINTDYLNWAKAAYKNIQERQKAQEEETPSTEAESIDDAQVQPDAVMETPAIEESSDETAILETVEVAEPPVEAIAVESPVEQQIAETVEVTEPPVEAIATEPSAEPQISEIVEVAESTAEAIAAEPQISEPVETTEPPVEGNAVESSVEQQISEAPVEETVSELLTPEPSDEAVLEATSDLGEEEPVAETATSLPFWASEDRQARVERLKATAVETLEPVESPAPAPVAAATQETAVEAETTTEIAFDEGFVWSAEVLASQGRRPEDVSIEEISWLKRLRQGLDKTRRGLVNQLKAIVGQGPLNQDAVMEIEALLLQADVGVEATDYIVNLLQQKLKQEVLPPEQAIAYLKQIIRDMLDRPLQKSHSPMFTPEKDSLNIWLMTGVNGVGKTTTIGKIAHLAQKSDYRCLIAAADTFRAAAVEQVKVWGDRTQTEVIANPGKNVDPAAVVFDAISAAQTRQTQLLLVDTAGRLQNKKNLMEELSKIRRIVDKKAPNAKIESLLVLDATLGQNGLRQAEVFAEAAQLSGVVLTKLDSTAKGGVALAVVQQLGLPIRFIGAGEGIEDLRPFSSYEFVEALLSG